GGGARGRRREGRALLRPHASRVRAARAGAHGGHPRGAESDGGAAHRLTGRPCTMQSFPPWVWDIPEHFNIAVACTDAHLGTPIATRTAVVVDRDDATDHVTDPPPAERTS